MGKKVERIDKTYVAPTFPLKQATATPQPTIVPEKFNSFLSAECALTFLYPSTLVENDISSQEAQLANNANRIRVSCDPDAVKQMKETVKEMQEETTQTVRSQKVSFYKLDTSTHMWIVNNTLIGKPVFFESSSNLTPLIIKTLEFVR